MDPARFVFLDETGTATNMTRRYGRCPSDQRLVAAVPHGHWRTTTFVAGLRQTGIVAPLVLDGPMTGTAFRAYVEQFLAPALAPGDVVVLDNLAAHKVDGVGQAIAAAGASILYLPPYSPDLNPIELVVGTLGGRAGFEEAADDGPELVLGPGGGLAQQRLELGEQLLDRVHVGAVGR